MVGYVEGMSADNGARQSQSAISHQPAINTEKQLKLSTAEIRWLVATGHIEGIPLKQLKTKKLKAMEYDFQLAAETLYARRRITLSLCGR